MANDKQTALKKTRRLKVTYVFLFLLLVGVVAFVLFRLNVRSKLRDRIDAIRNAGYPVTCLELDQWHTIPEGVENAADVIIDAFMYYQKPQEIELLPVAGRAELPARTEPLDEETKALVTQYVADNKQTLELLHKAAAIEHSRYPVDWSAGLKTRIYHLSDLRRCVMLLNLEAVLRAENNESQLAGRSIASALGVARSLEKEHLLISQIVRFSFHSLTVSTLERAMNRADLTDKQLADLCQVIADAQKLSGVSHGLVGERCQVLGVLREPESLDPGDIGASGIPPVPILEAYKALGLADMDAVMYLDLMDGYMKAARLPLHLRQEAAEAVEPELESISRIQIMLRMFHPAFSRLFRIELRAIAALRTAQAALAVQRFRLAVGKLPAALADLVPAYLEAVPNDPFDGSRLRYKRLEAGFVVYSVGDDLNDDGGRERPPRNERTRESSSWDITFIVER